jgi:hypothetical protein
MAEFATAVKYEQAVVCADPAREKILRSILRDRIKEMI